MTDRRILLYGYHGLHNAGAESRLLAILDQLRRRVPEARLVVASFDRHGLDYLSGVQVRYVNPARYRRSTRALIRDSDALVLTEGNLLSDAFTAQMVEVHTAAMEEAHAAGVPVVGLALDAGPLDPARRPRVMAAVNRLALLTLRTPAALADLLERGLTVPATVTADCAVSMPLPPPARRAAVRDRLGLAGPAVHGLAPVDFFMYPARIRPVGRPGDYVRYPFRGTWPGDGRARSARLVEMWAELGRRVLRADPAATVAVVAMDPSDVRICRLVRQAMDQIDRTRLVNCRELDTVAMSAALSGLASMLTSRYHALVLPLAYAVPFVALGHDNRLRYITEEMGLEKFFVPYQQPDLVEVMADRHASLLADAEALRSRLADAFADFVRRDQENYRLLADVVRATAPSRGGAR
jgi:polysaccharide pyruvyl transferase WcaK-like protein